jgi:transitional endoplasmic reticulum ATPase
MDELQIARSMLLRATQTISAASPEGKALLEWAREQAPIMLGTSRKDARSLGWNALKRALRSADGPTATPSPPLALASRLADVLRLDPADAAVVGVIAAIDRTSRVGDLANLMRRQGANLPRLIGETAGHRPAEAERRVRLNPLVVHGLVRFKADWRGVADLDLGWSLTRLFDCQPENRDGIIEAMIGPRHPAGLSLDAFDHVPDAEFLARLLAGARRERASGINILIHGPPGTGKTELARRIAAEAGLALFGVGEGSVHGYEPDREDRLGALELGHRLLGESEAALIFDEMEDLIGNATRDDGRVSGRRGSKVFVNRLLETNAVPVIWTTNTIDNVDDAILRRMSFVLHLGYPRRHAALAMLARIGAEEGVAAGEELTRLAEEVAQTATIARVAARGARLAGEPDGALRPAASLVRALHGNVLPQPSPLPVDFALYEADRPIAPLFENLAGGPSDVSVLLAGPPGTGKTALAHHFARMAGRPLRVKRASDLLSKWVGGTEANIAKAFEDARAEEAVLLFDEADSLLFDRTTARASWEVGQVNEMLTWLDRHPFPVIAATNLEGQLDPATKRRFTFKLQLRPLGREAAARAYQRFFGRPAPADLATLVRLTPGDFAVVQRQMRHDGALTDGEIVKRLAEEIAAKGEAPGRVGF